MHDTIVGLSFLGWLLGILVLGGFYDFHSGRASRLVLWQMIIIIVSWPLWLTLSLLLKYQRWVKEILD